jgi:hypothetical protein
MASANEEIPLHYVDERVRAQMEGTRYIDGVWYRPNAVTGELEEWPVLKLRGADRSSWG